MAKRMFIVIGIVVAVLVLIIGGRFMYIHHKYSGGFHRPPAVISATSATTQTWYPTISAVGTLTAVYGVNISPEVSGLVKAINFKSGQFVNKDQSLIQLDDAVDREDLKNFQAQYNLVAAQYKRMTSLFKTNAVSKADIDKAKSDMQQAAAQVGKSKEIIRQKNIVAPFGGKIGIRSVNLGQFVAPGDQLVTLQSLDPLYVQFSLPEQDLASIKVGQKIKVTSDVAPGKPFMGSITAIDAKVDEKTRSILVQATVPNKDYKLYPGTFAQIAVTLPPLPNIITLPQTAVTYSLYGDSAFVLRQAKGKDGKMALRAIEVYITVGSRKDNVVSVTKGIKLGDQVVTSGQLKLHSGDPVVVNNKVKL